MKCVAVSAIVVGCIAAALHAQTPGAIGALTNTDLVRLQTLGISERTILAVIQEAKQKQFDRNADSLDALKAAGVTDAVIAAVQRATTAPATVQVADQIDKTKFDKVYAAGMALANAVGSSTSSLGQIDRLVQAFQIEVANAKDRATAPLERSLANQYALAQLQFENGLAQANPLQRNDIWAKAAATLADANKVYTEKAK